MGHSIRRARTPTPALLFSTHRYATSAVRRRQSPTCGQCCGALVPRRQPDCRARGGEQKLCVHGSMAVGQMGSRPRDCSSLMPCPLQPRVSPSWLPHVRWGFPPGVGVVVVPRIKSASHAGAVHLGSSPAACVISTTAMSTGTPDHSTTRGVLARARELKHGVWIEKCCRMVRLEMCGRGAKLGAEGLHLQGEGPPSVQDRC